MFNEILTGKASVEPPKPASQDPYRLAGEVPPIEKPCTTCGGPYLAPPMAAPGSCGPCRQAAAQLQAHEMAMAFRAAEYEQQKKENSHKIFMAIGGAVVLILLAVFKFGMRSQMRDDAAQAAGYSSYDDYKSKREEASFAPSDDYSQRIHSMAREACACTDLKCAREIKATYVYYVRSHSASDEDAERAAAKSTDELYRCTNAFETP